MQNKRLGCLTFNGLLAALLTLLAIAGLGLAQGGQMFSPGKLNAQVGELELAGVKSHAQTAGRCAACHVAPWSRQTMSARCLACHSELLENPDDFHTVMLAQAGASACYRCHTDHHGLEASLTKLDLADFPHDSLRFSLRAHRQTSQNAAFVCADCHPQGFGSAETSASEVAAICTQCHAQIDLPTMQTHIQAFGSACLGCHDGVDRFGDAFDHNRLAFPLDGRHAGLACTDCHSGAQTLNDLRSARSECMACHAKDDPHQGQFGQDCAACHTPTDWEEATFDHSKAAFQLTGAHTSLACEQCHLNNVFKGTPQACVDCHAKDDSHQGQFGQDCAGCHTPADWKDATFDHSKAAFQLTGAHIQVECTRCHTNDTFKGTPQECLACHADPAYHIGLFPTTCAACHTTEAWRPAAFDQPHTFPINHGEGGPSACQTCHPQSLTAYTCYGCHEHDPNQTAAKHREEGISDFADCMRCHPTGQEEEGGD